MNLTVGPLPPAVYWRRRAIVAGSLLVLIVLVVYSCNAFGGSGGSKNNATSPTHHPSPTPSPRTSSQAPILGGPGGAGASSSASPAPGGQATTGAPAPTPGDVCTDSEIQLAASFMAITGGSAPYQLSITIKNISNRTCKRDVGPGPQELHVVLNGQTLWSSDMCPNARTGSDVRTFQPNIEDVFNIGWDGGQGRCTGGTLVGAGTYQVVARLDTKTSPPTSFTITGPGK